MSKAVITVISGTLEKRRQLFCVRAIKALIYKMIFIQTLPLHSESQKILT